MKPLTNINVTAIGAKNLIKNLHVKNNPLLKLSSLKVVFFFTIYPTNIAIINPPNGNNIFDVSASRIPKNDIPKTV